MFWKSALPRSPRLVKTRSVPVPAASACVWNAWSSAGADDAVGARIGDRERHGVARGADDVDFAPDVAHVLVDPRRAAREAGGDFALEVERDFVAGRADQVAIDAHEAAAAAASTGTRRVRPAS